MSIGTQNLGEGLLWIGVFVAVVAVLCVVTVWIARRRGSTTVALDAASSVAQGWLFLMALGVGLMIWQWFTQTEISVSGMPVSLAYWPGAGTPGCDDTGGDVPVLLCATGDAVDATVAHLTLGTRVVMALGQLLGVLLAAIPAVLVIVLVHQTRKGSPFTRVASRSFAWAAVGILVLGTVTDLVVGIGRTLAAFEVLPTPEGGGELTNQGIFYLTVPLWPAAVALALAALAVVFRYGSALQHQTEALRRDTEGLV
ncbi:MAG: hypothetical protein J0J04_11285 [Microbacterium sp.]|uniref:hypothetical protein n=1 Tax=unclassified Microbacterium TaxID=2609290 RepID=UPI000AA16AD6|nr:MULTISPECIES: hypothetical protein [unclassified Microbacterium]MBN9215365.1 hypothetical protein [Microbacterium sp.]